MTFKQAQEYTYCMEQKKRIILRVVACCLIPVGILLIVLGCTALSYYPFGDPWFGKTPQMGAVIPGAFLCFISIGLFASSFANPDAMIERAGRSLGEIIKIGQAVGSASTEKTTTEKQDEPRSSRCPGCGAPITKESGKFCNFCGTKL